MNYQLIISFPITGAGADDFDRLIIIENELGLILRDEHQVTGHEIGAGEMNIIIHTSAPDEAFELVKDVLSERDLEIITASFRNMKGDDYSLLWPEQS